MRTSFRILSGSSYGTKSTGGQKATTNPRMDHEYRTDFCDVLISQLTLQLLVAPVLRFPSHALGVDVTDDITLPLATDTRFLKSWANERVAETSSATPVGEEKHYFSLHQGYSGDRPRNLEPWSSDADT
ncbi:hypothetical protein TNCV_2926001 [Trichonephila clavipes]|nr:hypothetical protein TNCV_2926001 [Trichonephila clavipes]